MAITTAQNNETFFKEETEQKSFSQTSSILFVPRATNKTFLYLSLTLTCSSTLSS
jgi:hypothetical protein